MLIYFTFFENCVIVKWILIPGKSQSWVSISQSHISPRVNFADWWLPVMPPLACMQAAYRAAGVQEGLVLSRRTQFPQMVRSFTSHYQKVGRSFVSPIIRSLTNSDWYKKVTTHCPLHFLLIVFRVCGAINGQCPLCLVEVYSWTVCWMTRHIWYVLSCCDSNPLSFLQGMLRLFSVGL